MSSDSNIKLKRSKLSNRGRRIEGLKNLRKHKLEKNVLVTLLSEHRFYFPLSATWVFQKEKVSQPGNFVILVCFGSILDKRSP